MLLLLRSSTTLMQSKTRAYARDIVNLTAGRLNASLWYCHRVREVITLHCLHYSARSRPDYEHFQFGDKQNRYIGNCKNKVRRERSLRTRAIRQSCRVESRNNLAAACWNKRKYVRVFFVLEIKRRYVQNAVVVVKAPIGNKQCQNFFLILLKKQNVTREKVDHTRSKNRLGDIETYYVGLQISYTTFINSS